MSLVQAPQEQAPAAGPLNETQVGAGDQAPHKQALALPPLDETQAGEGDEAPAAEPRDAGVDNFPSTMICPFVDEPPTRPYCFNVPNANGVMPHQVFEWAHLYRYVAHVQQHQPWHVKHPMNGQFVRRHEAHTRIAEAPQHIRDAIRAERRRRGLPDELRIVSQDDIERMTAMVRMITEQ